LEKLNFFINSIIYINIIMTENSVVIEIVSYPLEEVIVDNKYGFNYPNIFKDNLIKKIYKNIFRLFGN